MYFFIDQWCNKNIYETNDIAFYLEIMGIKSITKLFYEIMK